MLRQSNPKVNLDECRALTDCTHGFCPACDEELRVVRGKVKVGCRCLMGVQLSCGHIVDFPLDREVYLRFRAAGGVAMHLEFDEMQRMRRRDGAV